MDDNRDEEAGVNLDPRQRPDVEGRCTCVDIPGVALQPLGPTWTGVYVVATLSVTVGVCTVCGSQMIVQRVTSMVMLRRGPYSTLSFNATAAKMTAELGKFVTAHTMLTAHYPPAFGTELVRVVAWMRSDVSM
jgi:hypothetical protein